MKMNKFVALQLLPFSSLFFAQKIGVVDTGYLLDKYPEYKQAESRLNAQVKAWQEEILLKQSNFEKKKELFENEKVLLVADQLKQRQNELIELEKDLKSTIAARFGSAGEINSLRSSLAKPYQDQIWNAIKMISDKNSLGIVLDKSNNMNVLFLDKKYDYTEKVLEMLLKASTKNSGSTSNETRTQQKPESNSRLQNKSEGLSNQKNSNNKNKN